MPPFTTKSYEVKFPKSVVPTSSIRTIVRPESFVPPKTKSYAEFVDSYNPQDNCETSDSIRLIVDTQNDQRSTGMFLHYFATSTFAAIESKHHSMITPASIAAYELLLFHAFHLHHDRYSRFGQSRHAVSFLADSDRRDLFELLNRATVPSHLESYLRQFTPSSDPRRPNIRIVPSYAGFSFNHDFGRFIPASFYLQAHNVLATSKTNSDPNDVTIHWQKMALATNANTVLMNAGNIIGTTTTAAAATTPVSTTAITQVNWFSESVNKFFTPIVARTIAQRYVFGPVSLTAPDFNEVSNMSTGMDGSVNTSYDVEDINPYVFALSCDHDNIEQISKFIDMMSEVYEDAGLGSSTLGKICQDDSNVNIFAHAYVGPTLQTWSTDTTGSLTSVRSKIASATITERKPSAVATANQFLTVRNFVPSNRDAISVYPILDPSWTIDPPTARLRWGSQTHFHIMNVKSTAVDPPTDHTYLKFNPRLHVVPNQRILLPFDANPSESHVPGITGRIIEIGEIDAFAVRTADDRLTLEQENSFLLASAIPLRYIHQATDLAVSLVERRLIDENEDSVCAHMYDMSLNPFVRLVSDFEEAPGFVNANAPHGFQPVDNAQFSDLISNKVCIRKTQVDKYSPSIFDPNVPAGWFYTWSPYRYVRSRRSPRAWNAIDMIVDFRPLYGLVTPLIDAPHYSKKFPSH